MQDHPATQHVQLFAGDLYKPVLLLNLIPNPQPNHNPTDPNHNAKHSYDGQHSPLFDK